MHDVDRKLCMMLTGSRQCGQGAVNGANREGAMLHRDMEAIALARPWSSPKIKHVAVSAS